MAIIKELNVSTMYVRVFENRNEMGKCAGTETAQAIRKLLSVQGEVNMMFAAAPSQNDTLTTLVREKGIDWSRVNAFHMDEYIGLSERHSASFRNYLKRTVFNYLPFKSVHLLNGTADDIDVEAARYTSLLRQNPLDICMLGIGENGHLAFNDPEVADFFDSQSVKIVALDRKCRQQQVNDGCFEKLEDVPKTAMTVTMPELLRAKYVFCSVPTAAKREAVYTAVKGAIGLNCPASIMRLHKNARLYLDKQSAELILQ